MRIISFNVNGLKSYMNYIKTTMNMEFATFLSQNLKVDILCIQEVRGSTRAFKEVEYFKDYIMYVNHNKTRNGYCGVAIIIKKVHLIKSVTTEFDSLGAMNEQGRVIQIDFGDFKILNVYFPYISEDNGDIERERSAMEFYLMVGRILGSENNTIVCGDFNAVYQVKDHYQFKQELIALKFNIENGFVQREKKILKDRITPTELPYRFDSVESLEEYLLEGPRRKWLHDFVKDESYVDCFEYVDPKRRKYTCWNTQLKLRERNLGTRIDYIFVPSAMKEKIIVCDILDEFEGSDHCPVLLEIDLEIKYDGELMHKKRNTILSFIRKV